MEAGGVQCGFCTPGILITARALLNRNPNPNERRSAKRWSATCAAARGISGSLTRLKKPRSGSEVKMAPKTSDNPIAPVGESVTRLDAREKVTGSATYADDFQFGPGLLHARIVAQSASAWR